MLDLLKKRRSIRQYTKEKLSKEQVERIIKAALLSPTSRNGRSWEFILVDDEELLEKLAESKQHGSSFLREAALGIVVMGNAEITDVWIEDASIAASNIHLTAASMGLGSCWIQIRERRHDDKQSAGDYIHELLSIPKEYKILSILSVGYPGEEKPPHDENKLPYAKVHLNKYGESFFA